jgi:A/G-specific adenine glycosylase
MPRDPQTLPSPTVAFDPDEFRARVRSEAAPHWRELPWRRTRDPYLVWVSEVMLQQTQVARVEGRWDGWLGRFPTVRSLADASDADVLAAWQGMGYNRRALALHRAAQAVVERHGGTFPHDRKALLDLPGVGPSTAAGIRAFAFDEADVYLETNVRAVFIHELFPTGEAVPDKALVPLVEAACPASGNDVRGWYYALLDLGAHLKKTVPNPSRRSASYTRQSRFEGSLRQKRAEVVRILLAAREEGIGLTFDQVEALLTQEELASGRPEPGRETTGQILEALEREGFCARQDDLWRIGAR